MRAHAHAPLATEVEEDARTRLDAPTVPRWLGWLWARPVQAGALVVAVVAVLATVAVWQMPRGPVTTPGAVGLLVASMVVGVVAGGVLRSRWVFLVAPATLVAVYEVAWLRIDGPMTDAPPLDSIIGWMIVLLGRGWLAAVALLPMLVGMAYGRAMAQRVDTVLVARPHLPTRVAVGVGTVAVVVLLAGVLRPVGTPPIVDADGAPVAGSIAELTTIEVGGHEQDLLLRGVDATNPVLLYAAGGPGGSDIGAMRLFGHALEQDFVVATWEQRGAGKAYTELDPRATLTVDQMVDDLVAVADHLRARFDQEQVWFVGNSWGTTIGVLAAQAHPDRFAAVVGTGQMVSQRATDVLMYEDLLTAADAAGDAARVAALEEVGPPPYTDVADYAPLLVRSTDDGGASTEWPANTFVREYSLVEQVTTMPALLESFATLYPQLQDVDFRRDVPRLAVPIWVVDGADEDPARASLAAEWLDQLDAPRTERVVLDDAGHRPHLQQPEAFAAVMRDVLAATRG